MSEINIEFDKPEQDTSLKNNSGEDQTKETSEYLSALQRLKAEFDNYRKRTDKEKMELSKFVEGNLIQRMIPVLDDFERLLQTETSDKLLQEGCRLIYENITSIFKTLGLETYSKIGDGFDPNKHEAISVDKVSEEYDNKIMSISQKGYIFKDRILRHAKVTVGQHDKS